MNRTGIRAREAEIRVSSIAATLLLVASASHALDFGNAVVVYRETFTETSSLTPEVDAFSAGGLLGLSSLPGSAPVLTGSAAHVHLPFPSAFTSLSVGFLTDVFGTKVVGVRASYANLTSGTPGDITAILTANLSGGIPALVQLAVFASDPGNEVGILDLNFLAGPIIVLPTEAVLGLLAGNAFEIDLFFDRTAETATASIEIDGIGSFQTAPHPLPGLGAAESTIFLQEAGFLGTGPNPLDIDITSFEIYADPPQLPALGYIASGILGALLMVGGRHALAGLAAPYTPGFTLLVLFAAVALLCPFRDRTAREPPGCDDVASSPPVGGEMGGPQRDRTPRSVSPP